MKTDITLEHYKTLIALGENVQSTTANWLQSLYVRNIMTDAA
ncbi:hypothetical protein [Bartonella tamiae]|nr:hypothetical protein [Bartonella tamiae]EJF93690.1 hypothetical protein MEG_01114 [Bartonella tamiae Th307]